jgi:two-component system OmpR family response regulator
MSTRRRVLVVDDDASIRDLVDMALSDDGYEVISAAHGAAALVLVGRAKPDVILLDMRMPVMNGRTFAQANDDLQARNQEMQALAAERQEERARLTTLLLSMDEAVLVVDRTGPGSGRCCSGRW